MASTLPVSKRCSNAARTLGDPIIVAPAEPQSGVSHAVTWHEGVRIEPRGEKQSGSRFAIHGTPADCTRLGLLHLVPDAKWILSGINHGANLGADVYYSGTVAAVREAVLHGWPGIAVSHYRKSGVAFDWERRDALGHASARELFWPDRSSWAFSTMSICHSSPPAPLDPEVAWCPLDPKPLPLNYRHEEESGLYFAGDYNLRAPHAQGADVDVCFSGRIAVSQVKLL